MSITGEWNLDSYLDSEAMDKLKMTLATEKFLPHKDYIFKAYESIAPKDVKLLIIGQDPYPNPRAQPDGLAFSAAYKTASLERINEAIVRQTPYKLKSTRLKYLADEGVMLLNSCLTVKPYRPGSHEELGWERLVAATIDHVLFLPQPLAIWALGSRARKLVKGIYSRGNKLIITSEHPANAARDNRPWRTDGFKKLEQFYNDNNVNNIVWGPKSDSEN